MVTLPFIFLIINVNQLSLLLARLHNSVGARLVTVAGVCRGRLSLSVVICNTGAYAT